MQRRTFIALGLGAFSAACAGACTGADDPGLTELDPSPDPNALPSGVTTNNDEIRIEVDRIPALASDGGVLFLRPLATIVVRESPTTFRALTAICTHAGCQVRERVGVRLRCPCHGSEFALDGRVEQGPAESPLFTFPSRFDATARLLTIERD